MDVSMDRSRMVHHNKGASQTTNAATYIVQAFLNFERLSRLPSRTTSPQRSRGVPRVLAPSPEHPFLLRLPDNAPAEVAALHALQLHYAARWADRVQLLLTQLAEEHNVRPSDGLAAQLAAVGKVPPVSSQQFSRSSHSGSFFDIASSGVSHAMDKSRRLSSVEQKKERTHDDIIRAVLHQEERTFYEAALPSRFLEDYQVFVVLSDGTLPNPNQTGAVSTGLSHAQQQKDLMEHPRDWLVESSAVLKQHPKASFPYTISVFYKPTKATQTMNEIMSRSAAFVSGGNAAPYAGSSDANVSGLVAAVSSSAPVGAESPIRAAVHQLLQQSAPKNMLDDEGARRRGYTILRFLPPLRNDTTVDPHTARLLAKLDRSKKTGGDGSFVADADDDDDRDRDIDLTVEDLLRETGLTMYDLARHGTGPLHTLGRDSVLDHVPQMVRADVERKRQENVIKAEREELLREETAIRLADAKELTLREQHTLRQAEARRQQEKDAMTEAKEKVQLELEKEKRRLALEARVRAYKEQEQKELAEAKEREKQYLQQLEVTLRDKTFRRVLDTTLEGERTKAEALSRMAGPVSLRLNDFRPKVKQLDQEQRQSQYLSSVVQLLDQSATADEQLFSQKTAAALHQRGEHQRTVESELLVRTTDGSTLHKKEGHRTSRVQDRIKQHVLLARPQSEISVMQIAGSRPETLYHTTVDDADEKEEAFSEWKNRRRVQVEASLALKELGFHAKK